VRSAANAFAEMRPLVFFTLTATTLATMS